MARKLAKTTLDRFKKRLEEERERLEEQVADYERVLEEARLAGAEPAWLRQMARWQRRLACECRVMVAVSTCTRTRPRPPKGTWRAACVTHHASRVVPTCAVSLRRVLSDGQ